MSELSLLPAVFAKLVWAWCRGSVRAVMGMHIRSEPAPALLGRQRERDDVRWWTWAGFRANATLAATLSDLTDGLQRFTDIHLRMRTDLTPEMWKAATTDAAERLCLPEIDHDALTGLKFSEALPEHLATATLAARLADIEAAATVLGQPVRFSWSDQTNR
jgi:ATP-dependent Lhr-like helicase